MTPIDLLGFLGMILLLSGFILNQLKKVAIESTIYQVLNFVGAYILSYYAYMLNNIPFLSLEFVWGSFALYQLVINLARNRKAA